MQDLLWVLNLPANQCVSSVSAHSLHVSVSHFRLLKWETLTFISSNLYLQDPDLNPVNYKICIEIQQRIRSASEKFITWTDWHYGMAVMASSNASSITLQTSGVNVSVCSCKRTTFLVFSLTADSTFIHFNVLVWSKLQVRWCYCVEYTRFSPFLLFYISQGSVAT